MHDPNSSDGMTLADLEAAKGTVPIPPDAVFHQSTDAFFEALERLGARGGSILGQSASQHIVGVASTPDATTGDQRNPPLP